MHKTFLNTTNNQFKIDKNFQIIQIFFRIDILEDHDLYYFLLPGNSTVIKVRILGKGIFIIVTYNIQILSFIFSNSSRLRVTEKRIRYTVLKS